MHPEMNEKKAIRFSWYYFSVLVLIFSSYGQIYSQPENWNIHYFTTDDGLSSNHINAILKDSYGFLWIGTENGLNRYDGYKFSSLRLPGGDPHPLSGIKILSIFEDSDSILWIGASDGLYRFDPIEPASQIKHYYYFTKNENLSYRSFQSVNNILEDKNGLLWITCNDPDEGVNFGLRTFNKETEVFSYITIDSSFTFKREEENLEGCVTSLLRDMNDDLWFGTGSGLARYDDKDQSFKIFKPSFQFNIPGIDFVISIFDDNHNHLWISNKWGFSLFDKEKESFGEFYAIENTNRWKYKDHSVSHAAGEDQNGYTWMRPSRSIVRFKYEESGIIDPGSIEAELIENTSAEINPSYTLCIENPWLVWLGVPDRGLCQVNVRRNTFRTIKPTSLYRSGVFDLDYVNAIGLDKDENLWMTWIDPGAIKLDRSNNKSAFYDVLPGFGHGIHTDEYGNLWFAARWGTVSKAIYDENNHISFKIYWHNPEDPLSVSPRIEAWQSDKGGVSMHMYEHLLYTDRNGTLWFNSSRGIHDRYDPIRDGFVHLDHRKVDYINNDTILEAEIEGEIWFPSAEGLLRIIPPFKEVSENRIVPGETIIYKNNRDDKTTLNSNWVRSICFSKNYEPGTLWVATIGGGLNKMMREQKEGTALYKIRFEHFTEANGLCNNNVLGILEDESGNLWLSTLNGLSRFDPRTGIFDNFYEIDGLPTNHFTWSDPCQDSSGEMFFPSESGILSFHPDSIEINQEIPPVMITDFRIFNQTIYPGNDSPLKKNISFTRRVELDYNQNFISLEFAALNFEQPEKNQYRYMLENLDRDWIQSGTRQYAEYTGLRPGKYLFRVQGSNNSGIWNETGASLQIIIHSPPWFSWWAYIIYFLLATGIIVWYRNYLMNRAKLKASVELERMEKDKLKEMDRMKSRFFANVSHEFRTPLTLILGPAESALKKKKSNTERQVFKGIIKNAKRLLLLVGQLLDISKLESGILKLNISSGDLIKFIRSIILTYTSLAESKKVEYLFELPVDSPVVWFDSDKIEKILGNLISNAIKFTPAGGTVKVSVALDISKGNVHIAVTDSGIGIPPEEQDRVFERFYRVNDSDDQEVEGTGIGLAITRELVDLYRGEIRMQSDPGKGSTFTVVLPVIKEQFRPEEIEEESDQKSGQKLQPIQGISPEEKLSPEIRNEPKQEVQDDKPIVLIVEDNIELIHFIADILGGDYHILTAENGRNGLDQAIENIPDLIISDVMMPEMDGQEMCRMIREDSRTSHIPIIMLTAKADRDSKLEGLETGADDYIIKPFDAEELTARVRNLIRQRELLREKFTRNYFETSPTKEANLQYSMLREVMKVFEERLGEPEFTMDELARILGLTRSHLFRKVHAITGSTPNELLRMVRMKRAARLFRTTDLNVTQVMYEVGMKNPSHFAKSFKKYLGVNPAEYKGQHYEDRSAE